MRMVCKEKDLILIPAFNEEQNIAVLLKKIDDLRLDCDVVVIDDGSSDQTVPVVLARGAGILSLPFNVGIGGAVQTGFQYALSKNSRYVVRIDADGQHDPLWIENLLLPLKEGRADMVVGSRFLPPQIGYRSSMVRRIGIQFFSGLISMLTGLRVTDPTSGFSAYNRRAINYFARHYPIDYPECEAIMLCKKAGLRFCEVPVKMEKRLHGLSSIRYMKTLYYMIKVTMAIMVRSIQLQQEGEKS